MKALRGGQVSKRIALRPHNKFIPLRHFLVPFKTKFTDLPVNWITLAKAHPSDDPWVILGVAEERIIMTNNALDHSYLLGINLTVYAELAYEFSEAVNLGKYKNKRLVKLQVLLADYKSFVYD